MKKAMKLVWMVLVALPMIAITSCSKDDDDPENALFKDYSTLIGKTRQGVIDYIGEDPYSQDSEYQFFVFEEETIEYDHVVSVTAMYDDEEGNVLDKVSNVGSVLDPALKNTSIQNYLNEKYDYEFVDEDGDYVYTKKDLYIFYTPATEDSFATVLYIDSKAFSRAGEAGMLEVKRALKARLFNNL